MYKYFHSAMGKLNQNTDLKRKTKKKNNLCETSQKKAFVMHAEVKVQ